MALPTVWGWGGLWELLHPQASCVIVGFVHYQPITGRKALPPSYFKQPHFLCTQDEGSHSTDVPTPGNTENEPPEKETLQRFPGPPPTGLEPESPSPAEAPSGKKRRRHGREDKEQRGRRTAPSLLTMDDFPVQVLAWFTAFVPTVESCCWGIRGVAENGLLEGS